MIRELLFPPASHLKPPCSRLTRTLFLTGFFAISMVGLGFAQERTPTDYVPEFKPVRYSKTVPTSIRRAARGGGRTRFYATFKHGKSRFAIHLYDKGRVVPYKDVEIQSEFKRASRLDVFQLSPKGQWRLLHSSVFDRYTNEKGDPLSVSAQLSWLDPARKSIPLIKLETLDNRSGEWGGNLTEVYVAITGQTNSNSTPLFVAHSNPSNGPELYSSEISFPDANGNVTLLRTDSSPESASIKVMGWSQDGWKQIDSLSFLMNDEQASFWNGQKFVLYSTVPDYGKGTSGN